MNNEEIEVPDVVKRLWAPWREDYVRGIDHPEEDGCFLCNASKAGEERDKLVLYRGDKSFVIINRYPYNPGHIMVACNVHLGEIDQIDNDASSEMWALVCRAKKVLSAEMKPQGFNIGINQGRCAGAGVVGHLHIHIVPRWNGDCNFMPVTGQTRVMSQSLEALYDVLQPVFEKLD